LYLKTTVGNGYIFYIANKLSRKKIEEKWGTRTLKDSKNVEKLPKNIIKK